MVFINDFSNAIYTFNTYYSFLFPCWHIQSPFCPSSAKISVLLIPCFSRKKIPGVDFYCQLLDIFPPQAVLNDFFFPLSNLLSHLHFCYCFCWWKHTVILYLKVSVFLLVLPIASAPGDTEKIQLSVWNPRILLLTLQPPTIPSHIPCRLSSAVEDSYYTQKFFLKKRIKHVLKTPLYFSTSHILKQQHGPLEVTEIEVQGAWITYVSIF